MKGSRSVSEPPCDHWVYVQVAEVNEIKTMHKVIGSSDGICYPVGVFKSRVSSKKPGSGSLSLLAFSQASLLQVIRMLFMSNTTSALTFNLFNTSAESMIGPCALDCQLT